MTATEIADQAKKLILQQVGAYNHHTELALLSLDERLDGAALGYDSFDRAELRMALEEAFAIDIPDAAAEKFCTVGDVVRYCQDAANDKEQREAE